MAIPFLEYLYMKIQIERKTPGGDTYYLDGKPTCFRYVKSHKTAVRLLTCGASHHVEDIVDSVVDDLLKEGLVYINDDACLPGHGWMGCKVWDKDKTFVGTIGDRCSLAAGMGTPFSGFGRCKYHLPPSIRKTEGVEAMSHGRTSKSSLRRMVAERMAQYANDPDRMSITRELNLQRSLLDTLLEKLYLMDEEGEVTGPEIVDMIGRVEVASERVVRSVDKQSTIDHRTALTAGQVLYIQTCVIDVMRRYIPTELLQAAAKELADRLGTRSAFGSPVLNISAPDEEAIVVDSSKRVPKRVARTPTTSAT